LNNFLRLQNPFKPRSNFTLPWTFQSRYFTWTLDISPQFHPCKFAHTQPLLSPP
jgi:hypothetical protein